MDLFNIVNKPQDNGGLQEVKKEPPQLAELTEDQRLQLMQYMEELKAQRITDPAAFQKTMESLGLGSTDGSLGSAGGNLSDLTSAIGDMRSSKGSDTPSISVNMPGGKSVLGQSGIENKQKGITITPIPGFTVKTKATPSGSKVFINLCTHEEIDAPSVKKKLNDKGESVEGMNVPLSVGPQYLESDHAGIECIVFDIIVNIKVIEDCIEDETGQYRDFLCHLCIQSVEQKYPALGTLDRQYKLPKLKYMGAIIKSQYIRDRKNVPKIQEVSETPAPVPKTDPKKNGNLGGKKTNNKEDDYQEPDRELPYRLVFVCEKIIGEINGNEEVVIDAEKLNENEVEIRRYKSENGSTIVEYETPIILNPNEKKPKTINNDDNENNLENNNNSDKNSRKILRNEIGREYTHPILVPSTHVKSVALFFDIPGSVDTNKIDVNISPFKFQVKVPGYKLLLLYLPCAVLPVRTYATLKRPEGYVNRIEFSLTGLIDWVPWGEKADVGSKPWLMSQALSESVGEIATCESVYGEISARTYSTSAEGGDVKEGESDDYQEDKFHIKLPSNVDKYTGVIREDEVEIEEELPEDRFHKKDAGSSYLISQREQAVKDKWTKHEKEKLERQNDPDSNIEYVDVDDYKPGGKYGPPEELTDEVVEQIAVREELKRAANVVASSLKDSEIGNLLSSSLWTELLD